MIKKMFRYLPFLIFWCVSNPAYNVGRSLRFYVLSEAFFLPPNRSLALIFFLGSVLAFLFGD